MKSYIKLSLKSDVTHHVRNTHKHQPNHIKRQSIHTRVDLPCVQTTHPHGADIALCSNLIVFVYLVIGYQNQPFTSEHKCNFINLPFMNRKIPPFVFEAAGLVSSKKRTKKKKKKETDEGIPVNWKN